MPIFIQTLTLSLLISATALMTTTVNAQQVYKWKDDKGALHYTQTPPPARYAKSVNIKERPAPVVNTAKTATLASNTTANVDSKATAPATKPAPKLSAESCKAMQDNLALLQTGQRLYEKDAGGERAYMTEERRASQIQTYQQNIANGCK